MCRRTLSALPVISASVVSQSPCRGHLAPRAFRTASQDLAKMKVSDSTHSNSSITLALLRSSYQSLQL